MPFRSSTSVHSVNGCAAAPPLEGHSVNGCPVAAPRILTGTPHRWRCRDDLRTLVLLVVGFGPPRPERVTSRTSTLAYRNQCAVLPEPVRPTTIPDDRCSLSVLVVVDFGRPRPERVSSRTCTLVYLNQFAGPPDPVRSSESTDPSFLSSGASPSGCTSTVAFP